MSLDKQVPFFGVDRQFAEHREGLMLATEKALASGKSLQGPDVVNLENEMAELCHRRYGVAVGSCTDALAFSLYALNIGPGDEVIVPAISFFASVSCVLRVGATPVFADIDMHFGMIDTNKLESLINAKTKAIIAVHLYGQTLDMADLERIAKRNNIALVEDAAQALGAKDKQRPAGSMGQTSCISFDPTKVLNASGSGGIVLTDDSDIYEAIKRLRYHGRDQKTREIIEIGYNSQLASDKAAQLRYKLAFLKDWQKRRAAIADYYNSELSNIPGIGIPTIRPGSTHNWHKYVLDIAVGRDGLREHLKQSNVSAMVHYDKTLADEPVIQALQLDPLQTNTPVAKQKVKQVLSLPIFAELTDLEVEKVVSSIKTYYTASPMRESA